MEQDEAPCSLPFISLPLSAGIALSSAQSRLFADTEIIHLHSDVTGCSSLSLSPLFFSPFLGSWPFIALSAKFKAQYLFSPTQLKSQKALGTQQSQIPSYHPAWMPRQHEPQRYPGVMAAEWPQFCSQECEWQAEWETVEQVEQAWVGPESPVVLFMTYLPQTATRKSFPEDPF